MSSRLSAAVQAPVYPSSRAGSSAQSYPSSSASAGGQYPRSGGSKLAPDDTRSRQQVRVELERIAQAAGTQLGFWLLG